MPITRQYLRWSQTSVFGCIGSQNADIVYISAPKLGPKERLVATAVCEYVIVWDTKTGEQVVRLCDESNRSAVTVLAANGRTGLIASGHADGTVRLFDYISPQLKVTFSGHKTAVTALCFDAQGLRLASGGKDTEIVVWDVTTESGLFRLKGHKGVVTKVQFMAEHPFLVSASKDTYIKFWDMNGQHCFKTLIGHRSEVWSFVVFDGDRRLISGAADSELRVWNVVFRGDDLDVFSEKMAKLKVTVGDEDEELEEENDLILVERMGTVMRRSVSKLANIAVDDEERVLICHGKESSIECFKLRTDEEVRKAIRKRLQKERKRRKGESLEEWTEEMERELVLEKTVSDEIEKLDVIKTSSAVRSCDVHLVGNECKVSALLSDNSVELYSFRLSSKPVPSLYAGLRIHGHRTDVRALAISSDNYSIVSASAESVKVWNRSTCRCVATITEGVEYGLCCVFAPGDRYVITGTKTGKLQIFDINSAELLQTIDASEDLLPVWSLCLTANSQGLVTGCEDKLVKFWTFELTFNEKTNGRHLAVVHQRSLKMDEGVLCVRVSPNGKFIAASLLDSTVKIFFCDTLKFFISLYGHKFPVLAMDISSDSALIATGSSDKNVKIWGMDFGDCHKSLFAHEDNVMCLQFVPKTHYFFTASKDRQVKEWDADSFEKIIALTGHQAEVWALAVAPNGKFVVTASHDKSLRVWEKTEEPLVLEEEQELEREKQFEDSLFANEETVIAGETNKETALPSKKTIETVKGAERLMEALDVFREEVIVLKEYESKCKACEAKAEPTPPKPAPNPLMNVYSTDCPYRYILEVFRRIKSNELEETLLTLPFNYTIEWLKVCVELLERRWERELLCRAVCFILRVNFGQITACSALLPTLDALRTLMADSVADIKDMLGVNTSALQYYQSILASNEEISLFREAFDKRSAGRKKRRQKSEHTSAPILSWNT